MPDCDVFILTFPYTMIDTQGVDHSIWKYYEQSKKRLRKPRQLDSKLPEEKLFFEGTITKVLERRHEMKAKDILAIPMISLAERGTATLENGDTITFHYMNGEAILSLPTMEKTGWRLEYIVLTLHGRLIDDDTGQPMPDSTIDWLIKADPGLAEEMAVKIRKASETRLKELQNGVLAAKNSSILPTQPST